MLLKGLKTFARQILREHGLVAEDDRRELAEERADAAAALSGEAEAEMAAAMEVDRDTGGSSTSGSGGEEEEGEGEGGGSEHGGHKEALLEAAEKGEAAGLLGDYLRGSPQLNDLLRLWDLDERKVKIHSAAVEVAVTVVYGAVGSTRVGETSVGDLECCEAKEQPRPAECDRCLLSLLVFFGLDLSAWSCLPLTPHRRPKQTGVVDLAEGITGKHSGEVMANEDHA